MREIFKGYYQLEDKEFKKLWDNAVFIFDTNVLLNLYRYQTTTRDALFDIMEQLSDRIWIPYHVGLEFQINRLSVIAKQNKRYSEARNIVTTALNAMENQLENLQLKERHSHINPDKLLKDISKVKTSFFKELESLEEKSISVSSEDKIRERIDMLFNDKIGKPPSSQEDLEQLYVEGEQRYHKQIPPGFEDSGKNDNQPDEFTHNDLLYKRKYGDLILWKQIIGYSKNKDLKDVIFITDDNKSDWWWKIDSGGTKTIGPRPELIEEMNRLTNVERLHMYSTEKFLEYANEYLNANVGKEAIEEVREVSVAGRAIRKSISLQIELTRSA
ncbi:MAG: PIN domain-containing protein, partial [Candidatus Dadabacteria bacterium]|nr:PIN domain-containing protein [Candidatus Dadabacteria bacterium]